MRLKVRDLIKNNHLIFFIITFWSGAFVFIYKIIGFYYASNDDIVMQSLVSGSAIGKSQDHLIFIMYPFGKIISLLFELFPYYDWYGLFLIGILFLCFGMITYRLLKLVKEKNNILIIAIGMVVLASLAIDSAVLFQFTVVSGVLASTAVFWIASSDIPKLKSWCISLILLVVAGIIRKKIFYMALPILVVIFISRFVRQAAVSSRTYNKKLNITNVIRDNRLFIIKTLLFFLVALVMFGVCCVVDENAYSNEPWNTYSRYIHFRSLITDYYQWPSYDENTDFWDSLNISREEYDCLPVYGILPDIDENDIEHIAKYAESSYYTNTTLGERLRYGWDTFIKAINSPVKREWKILFALAIIMMVIYCINKRDKAIIFEVLLCAIVVLAEIAYLCYKGRFPYHINIIFEYECVLAILGLFCSELRGIDKKAYCGEMIITFILSSIICIFMCMGNSSNIAVYKDNMDNYSEEYQYISHYPDRFFVLLAGGYVPQKKYTIHQIDNEAHNTAGTFVWPVFSPWMDIRFSNYNIDRHSDYLLGSNVYLLTGDLGWADKINKYYLSEGIINADYEIVDTIDFSNGKQRFLVKWVSN